MGRKEGTVSRGLQGQKKASDRARDRGRESAVWEHCRGRSRAGKTHPQPVKSLLCCWFTGGGGERAEQGGVGLGRLEAGVLGSPSYLATWPLFQTHLDSSSQLLNSVQPVGDVPPALPKV